MSENWQADRKSRPFDPVTVAAVWKKGRVIHGHDPNYWRHDIFGHVMEYTEYGNTNSDYGWEIDHIKPLAQGGADELNNLQPLQWKNKQGKGYACS